MIERCSTDASIVFILGDFTRLPLKKDSVDIILDIYGTGSYSLDIRDYPFDKVANRLNPGGRIFGAYLYGEPDNLKWTDNSVARSRFYLSNIQAALKDFEKLESAKLGGTEANKDIDGVKDGTPIYMWAYAGKKKGRP